LFVTILLLVIITVGLVVASPMALRAFDHGRQVDWSRLSDIGQTYGAVSAIVAAVALLGVTVSLVIQGREAKAARQTAQQAIFWTSCEWRWTIRATWSAGGPT
jgi:uncharacterized membrane protein